MRQPTQLLEPLGQPAVQAVRHCSVPRFALAAAVAVVAVERLRGLKVPSALGNFLERWELWVVPTTQAVVALVRPWVPVEAVVVAGLAPRLRPLLAALVAVMLVLSADRTPQVAAVKPGRLTVTAAVPLRVPSMIGGRARAAGEAARLSRRTAVTAVMGNSPAAAAAVAVVRWDHRPEQAAMEPTVLLLLFRGKQKRKYRCLVLLWLNCRT